MNVPTSEVGYTPAMLRREDHEVYKDMWWHWEKKKYIRIYIIVSSSVLRMRNASGRSCRENKKYILYSITFSKIVPILR